MVTIDVDPILVQWGPFTLSWHGLFLAAGVLLFYALLVRQGTRNGFAHESLSKLALGALALGFASARLLHVILNWRLYAAQPLRILAVYEGGITVNGAICGVLLTTVLFCLKTRQSWWKLADIMAVAAPPAFIVGRLGCTIAGDIWGLPTGGSWGLVYLHPDVLRNMPASLHGVPTVPIPILLQVWNLGLFGLLLALRGRRPDGFLLATYLLGYGLGRFLTGAWLAAEIVAAGLNVLQVVAFGLMLLGAALLIYLHWKPAGASVAGRGGAPGRPEGGLDPGIVQD
jgi:phosphatidylglycerol:prolipoprotein diacylglycerol transferase